MKGYYTAEFKTNLIMEYWNGSLSSRQIADKYDIPVDTFRQWHRWARKHGLSTIQASDCRQGYSVGFIGNVLQYLKTDAVTIRQTATHFKVDGSLVSRWNHQFTQGGIAEIRQHLQGARTVKKTKRKKNSAIRKNSYEKQIAELEQQLDDTKLENIILKKLQPQSRSSLTEKKHN